MQERSHKYEVELSEEQRFILQHLITKGNAPVRQQAHARILLKIDRNAPGPRWTDEQVAEAFEMSRYTVIRIRERFVTHGLDDALAHRLVVNVFHFVGHLDIAETDRLVHVRNRFLVAPQQDLAVPAVTKL